MVHCSICSTDFKDRRTFGLHLATTHKLLFNSDLEKEEFLVYSLFGKELVDKTVQEYIDEKFCIYNLPISIAKLIKLKGIKRSSKEERSTNRYKNKYLKSIQTKFGPNITNVSQVKEIQQKKEQTAIRNFGSYDEYLSIQRSHMANGFSIYIGSEKHKETIKKIESTCEERYGHKNFGGGDAAIEKSKQTKKKTISEWSEDERRERTSAARAGIRSVSSIELRVRKALVDLSIEPDYNKMRWGYSWDIVFRKTIIEVQGTYWHADPRKYKPTDLLREGLEAKDIWSKDERKKKKAESEGFTVVYVWEDEIRSRSDEQLIKFIQERLVENGLL